MIRVKLFELALWFTLALPISPPMVAQQGFPCRHDSLYHYLDFWIGDWWVTDTLGNLVGSSLIEPLHEGCAISESSLSRSGQEGSGIFFVDNNTRNWNQLWITDNASSPGGQKIKELIYRHPDGSLIFEGWYLANGRKIYERTILQPHSTDLVIQTMETSSDQKKSWSRIFWGIFIRKHSSFDIFSDEP